jgi:hypothetical protein
VSTTVASGATGTTQTFGTNNTTIATTAFVQAALQALHPVGSIYINATNSTNPGTLLGFGTWTAFGAGRVPVGFDAGNSLFNTAEETGGSYDATLVSHTHTWSGSATTSSSGTHTHSVTDPGHYHTTPGGVLGGGTGGFTKGDTVTSQAPYTDSATTGVSVDSGGAHTHTVSVSGTTASSGSSATNANVQPYITVYMWKRTA